MTTSPATTDTEAIAPVPWTGQCWECSGPCLTYKGTAHGWRCRACVDRYLVESDARALARIQDQRAAKFNRRPTNPTHVAAVSAGPGRSAYAPPRSPRSGSTEDRASVHSLSARPAQLLTAATPR